MHKNVITQKKAKNKKPNRSIQTFVPHFALAGVNKIYGQRQCNAYVERRLQRDYCSQMMAKNNYFHLINSSAKMAATGILRADNVRVDTSHLVHIKNNMQYVCLCNIWK